MYDSFCVEQNVAICYVHKLFFLINYVWFIIYAILFIYIVLRIAFIVLYKHT